LALAASAAFAQESAAKAGTAPDKGDSIAVDEIVVTAQFRAQNLQDTPIAISAFTGAMLERKGAGDIAAAANFAPNVNLSKGQGGFGQFASVFVRGVGQSDIHFAVEPGVGIYVDDVYYGVMSGAVFQLLDTDRVEVLRGPQGTLAGKNSIGGAIKLFSKRPTDAPDAYVELGLGGRKLVSGRAATNITLIDDKLFARLSVAGRRRDGYVDRLDYGCATGTTATSGTARIGPDCKLGTQGGEEVWTARASLRYTPTADIDDTLIFDTVQDTSENPASKTLVQSPAWAGSANYITGAHSYTNYETYVSRPTGPGAAAPFVMPSHTPLDGWGVSNILKVDLSDIIKLQSITGYRKSNVTLSAQGDGTPQSIIDQVWHLGHRQFTQELRLSGEVGKIAEWTVGGYYYDAKGISEGRVDIPGGVLPGGGGINLDTVFRDPVRTKSKSVFAHTILHPIEKMGVTLAIRYTDDSKDFTFNRFDTNGNPHPALSSLVNLTRSFHGKRTDYRAGIDYKWSDAFMTYAQVSTGYKGGGINPRPFVASQALPFTPETLTTYEVGFKSAFLDRAIIFNAAAFYSKFKNLQGTLLRCDAISPFPGFPCTQTTNIGDADIKGFEAETVLHPTTAFSIDGSIGVLDFQYKRITAASGVTLDMRGIYAPKLTAAVGAQYEIDLNGKGSLTPRLDYNYRSAIYTDVINAPINRLPKLGLINARLTWKSRKSDWSVTLAATNLANKFYYESQALRQNAPYLIGIGRPGQPRQWSLTVRRDF
jgi:iron complex outermembrane receptor protein